MNILRGDPATPAPEPVPVVVEMWSYEHDRAVRVPIGPNDTTDCPLVVSIFNRTDEGRRGNRDLRRHRSTHGPRQHRQAASPAGKD